MRNIFLLLSCLLCLQACNDEKEVDWTPDALTVSCNETLEEAGDGHWKVTLPTEYKGTVKLEIQTDKAWEVAVNYMTTEEEKWIILRQKVVRALLHYRWSLLTIKQRKIVKLLL